MEGKSLIATIRQWPAETKSYVGELQMEMRRVTWPTRKQVQATTGVVIITVFGFAAYFFVIDTVFTKLMGQVFKTFARQ